jgi:hypothetical protein
MLGLFFPISCILPRALQDPLGPESIAMFPSSSLFQVAPYQHVVVVMSIVLGLSLTQLLKGLAQLYRTRNRVRPYWLHTAWVVLLIFFSLLLWWLFWNYRSIEEWSFFRFIVYLSPMIVFYFLTSIVIPDPSDPVTNYKEYYFSSRFGFFGTFALQVVLAHTAGVVVRGLSLLDPSNLFRLATVVLLLIAMRSTSERVHGVIVALCAIVMVAFITLFHGRLG